MPSLPLSYRYNQQVIGPPMLNLTGCVHEYAEGESNMSADTISLNVSFVGSLQTWTAISLTLTCQEGKRQGIGLSSPARTAVVNIAFWAQVLSSPPRPKQINATAVCKASLCIFTFSTPSVIANLASLLPAAPFVLVLCSQQGSQGGWSSWKRSGGLCMTGGTWRGQPSMKCKFWPHC